MDPDGIVYRNCHELLGFQEVPLENVEAQVPQVPKDRYKDLDHDDDKRGDFFVSTRFCEEVEVGGIVVRNAVDSHISIQIDPPQEPAPPHPSHFGTPDEPFDVYLVQWVTNNEPFATWMKQATGLGDKVKLVHNLVYDYNPVPGHNHELPGAVDDSFQLVVPHPASSPFSIDAKVYEPSGCASALMIVGPNCAFPLHVGQHEFVAENWWADTDEGTVIIHAEPLNGASGTPAGSGSVMGSIKSEDPDSPLGQMFGGPEPEGDQERPLCHGPDPNSPCVAYDTIGDPFASFFFTEVQLTKCVRGDSDDCTPH